MGGWARNKEKHDDEMPPSTHLYPVITVVGWILFRTRSLALLSSSDARRTTEVVPSPTSLSCWVARDTRIRA